jgi:hypothetical protein
MLTTLAATVTAISRAEAGIFYLEARADGETATRRAVAYPALTGGVAVGDRVVLNTTATALGLGTGGVDFVLENHAATGDERTFGEPTGDEHIIKLRYTPHQHAVRSVEMDPAYAEMWRTADSLEGVPVIVGGLHSQIAPAAAAFKAGRPGSRVAYVMTDSAALPIAFSRLVRELRDAGLIDSTLTAGQAFGGDYECVTDASALLAARHIAGADAIIIAAGPGNAGTGTRFGFSGIEQGPLLTLASHLGGAPIGILRLSFAEERGRHLGVSHHSVTTLGRLSSPATVVFPNCPAGVDPILYVALRHAVEEGPIGAWHRIVEADGAPGMTLLRERGVHVRSMGRSADDDPLFFHAAAAAGAWAAGQN